MTQGWRMTTVQGGRLARPARAALCTAAALLLAAATAAPAQRVAVFDFRLDDTSLQGQVSGPQPAEQARLDRLRPQLSELLAKSGRYQPVDIAPVEAKAKAANLLECGGCGEDYAKRVGAQIAVIGWVQKVSNLILNINVRMVDVATGRVLGGGSVDIRGDTDESWSRGLAYLAKYQILQPRTAQ